MPDVINVQSIDVQETKGTATYYFPPDSAGSLVTDLLAILDDAMTAGIQKGDQTINRFDDDTVNGYAGETPLVSQAAKMKFECTDLSEAFTYILGPRDGTFDAFGIVDTSKAWIIAYIDFMETNGVSELGVPFDHYVSGDLVELQPGWLDVNGAAAFARDGGLVSEFWAQDGVDVKVGEP